VYLSLSGLWTYTTSWDTTVAVCFGGGWRFLVARHGA